MPDQLALLVKEIAQSGKAGACGTCLGESSRWSEYVLARVCPRLGLQGGSHGEWQERAVCQLPGGSSFADLLTLSFFVVRTASDMVGL